MKNQNFQEEKGLFTFYKQQQIQQELLRLKSKKKYKNKHKKSKKKIKSLVKSSEKSVFVITQDNQEDQQMSDPKQVFERFLKDIRHRDHDENKQTNSHERVISNRIKTEPNNVYKRAKQNSAKAIKKTKILSQLAKKYNFLPPKPLSPLSSHAITPIAQIINYCQSKFYKDPKQSDNDPKIYLEREQQKSKILQRLRSMEIKNKSNLITSRQSINLRELIPRERCESENKNFLNQVASNLNENNKDAYKLLKEALKLPQIKRQIMRTQMSPSPSQKKLTIAAKNMPYQRKELRMKHSNERRREFYKLNIMAQITESRSFEDGPTINLIDMGRDYKQEGDTSSQEWQLKRRLIKSRLTAEN